MASSYTIFRAVREGLRETGGKFLQPFWVWRHQTLQGVGSGVFFPPYKSRQDTPTLVPLPMEGRFPVAHSSFHLYARSPSSLGVLILGSSAVRKPPLRFADDLLLAVLQKRGADKPIRVQAGGTLEEMVDGLDDFQVGELMRRKRVHLACRDVTPPLVPDGKRHGKGDFAYNRRSHRLVRIIADRPRKRNGAGVSTKAEAESGPEIGDRQLHWSDTDPSWQSSRRDSKANPGIFGGSSPGIIQDRRPLSLGADNAAGGPNGWDQPVWEQDRVSGSNTRRFARNDTRWVRVRPSVARGARVEMVRVQLFRIGRLSHELVLRNT